MNSKQNEVQSKNVSLKWQFKINCSWSLIQLLCFSIHIFSYGLPHLTLYPNIPEKNLTELDIYIANNLPQLNLESSWSRRVRRGGGGGKAMDFFFFFFFCLSPRKSVW